MNQAEVISLKLYILEKGAYNSFFAIKTKEHMMDEYVQEALEIVKAQAQVRNMDQNEMASMVKSVSESIKSIAEGGEAGAATDSKQEPPVDPKKAIREKSVICLECGKSMKVLTKRHLEIHGLTPDEYREKWGFKKNQALVAKALARQRKQKMQEMQLWKRRKA